MRINKYKKTRREIRDKKLAFNVEFSLNARHCFSLEEEEKKISE